jgi:NAD(P)-dependent dehydrogenase (short-subunit alcohol dehydrogenase family)
MTLERTGYMTADKVVMITGASSGIGESLAREYYARGWKTVLVARRVDRTSALARELGSEQGRSLAIVGDVTRDGDMNDAVARVQERFGRLDVAIANAGFGVNGAVADLGLEDYVRQFDTNVYGVIRTAQACLPALTDTRGTIAVVGSVSGFISTPGTVPYSMSKYAVRAWCEGARAEFAPRGVGVVHVAPGFVESEIRRVDRAGNFHSDHKDPIPSWLVMPAKKAAKQIVDGIDRRTPELVITGHGKVLVWLSRRAPALVRGAAKLIARNGVRITKPEV